MNVLLVDHEDSFVYNLYQSISNLGARVDCLRYTVATSVVDRLEPDAIVLSPGPGHPSERRLTRLARSILRHQSVTVPTLGVCLGHQIVGSAFGAKVVRAPRPVHGEVEWVTHDGDGLYEGLPTPFPAARYHSLVVDPQSVPADLTVTARGTRGVVMGVAHRSRPIFGTQFHPESYLTRDGEALLRNFLRAGRR